MENSPKESKSIGEIIHSIREGKGMSQKTLTYRTGIAQKTISRIENNIDSPRISTVLRLADALGVRLILEDIDEETEVEVTEPSEPDEEQRAEIS